MAKRLKMKAEIILKCGCKAKINGSLFSKGEKSITMLPIDSIEIFCKIDQFGPVRCFEHFPNE